MLQPNQLSYLISRGYTPELIEQEGVIGVEYDTTFEGKRIKDCAGCIGWPVYSMSGQAVGLQTRELEKKKYRFHQLPNTEHLPLVFGTKEDWTILWNTGDLILTEGAFDRAAIKRALPDRAVLARMSKGAPNQLRALLVRYAKTLWQAFDNDAAGADATDKAERKLGEVLTVNRLTFPYKDPAILLEKKGLAKTRELLLKQIRQLE